MPVRRKGAVEITEETDAALARSPLWSRPGFLIRRLNQIYQALFFAECEAFGITPVQYGLMTVLAIHPGIDQAGLAAELGIDRTNVADVLARLAERELIERGVDPRDRRVKVARLTRAGKQAIRAMEASIDRAQMRLLRPLPPEERERFLALLTRLVRENNEFGRTLFRPR
jgi:DNA-binding MarR family transcriptional regulator